MAVKYIEQIKSISGQASSGLTLGDALWNPKYRRATWTNIGYIIFHELTGINVITIYCNTIFHNMSSGEGGLSPRTGTYLVGIVNFLASFGSTQTVKYVGRKTLLIYGHIGIALVHSAVAIFSIEEINIGVVAMVMIFMAIY